jgi:hypothetical protein
MSYTSYTKTLRSREPSKVLLYYWIGVYNETLDIEARKTQDKSGKWLVFRPIDKLDDLWVKIANDVIRGNLGPSAKCRTLMSAAEVNIYDRQQYEWSKMSTAETNIAYHEQFERSKTGQLIRDYGEEVICVYTKDYADKDDMMRVRERLNERGITWKIPYKTDAMTLAQQRGSLLVH